MRKTIALAVAAVALAGCGMLPAQPGSGGGEEKQAATTGQQAGAPAEERTPEQPAEQPAEQQSAPPQSGQVIATHETDVSGASDTGRARVEVTGLKRQGKILTLNWTITAVEGKVNMHNGMGGGALDYSVSAVSLIDPINAKRYRVARNNSGPGAQCVCSDTQGDFLDKGDKSSLYAVFAAPPADVTKVNIEMPMIGVLTDVPIS
ncbi:hypothetical protein [Nonomuraea sp. SBT364]|uniref:hypothetical protein n=1 Tax=Nonomuraea sp. SBT364 TaxID=1580530 RepID=UPI0007C7112B|nr:hypothetical protein [Nonomuraea sp. SBT364]